MPVLDAARLIDERVSALRRFHQQTGLQRAELDLSGGIDSAVMLGLLARALGPERITAVHTGIHSDPAHGARAREVAEVFGVRLVVLDLTSVFEDLVLHLRVGLERAGVATVSLEADPTVLGSLRSTLRAPVGRALNRMTGGGIRHGTGNECEDRFVRFFQKGGDGEVDTNPIDMLSKAEVTQLGRALGVPRSVLQAVPSPDLWARGDRHNDEDELASFLRLDPTRFGQSFYGAIDLHSGAYCRVGLLERVSRLIDLPTREAVLFGDAEPLEPWWEEALGSPPLQALDPGLGRALLLAARRVERITRHKANPNCPALGSRENLVAQGILTNDLPEV